jgi:predicted dehydrogenase
MTGTPLRVGVIGCGNISDTYFRNALLFSDDYRITACADLSAPLAEAKAAEWGLTALTPEALIASPDIDIVLNLTIPAAHAEVTLAAIESGKHVYSEKPLCLSLAELDRIASRAAARGVQVACAPDTIMGGAVQAARVAIERGDIGRPLGATAAIMDRGMEDWHPNPGFFFQPGGGPVLDMGPYYLATLLELLGPVTEVTTLASIGVTDRRVAVGERSGEPIPVAVPTSVRALLRFTSGVDTVFLASWDVWRHSLPHLEVYGTEGTLVLPDPNWFGGAPLLSRRGQTPEPLDLSDFAWATPNRALSDGNEVADYRGLGLADLARAAAAGSAPKLGLSFATDLTRLLLRMSAAG